MNNEKDCLIGADVGLQQSHMMEVRDKEQPWLKKIEISRKNIQTNKQLSLIGAVVRLQQSGTLLCTLYISLLFGYRNIDVHFTETQ